MKKNVLVFGSIAGLIVSALMAISINLCYNSGNTSANMWIGYGSMILAFAFIFVGIKNYRDKYSDGSITFGKAFQIGFFITLIASTIYVLVWLVEYYLFIPDFMDKYAAHEIAQAKSSGATAAQMSATTAQMARYAEMYKNPLMVIVLTYMEILPVGLVVALIAALILKRKPGSAGAVPAV